jgi:hypothetical protein
MLSIDKAYSQEEVDKWLERIKKSAIEIDFDIRTIQIPARAFLHHRLLFQTPHHPHQNLLR